MRPQDPYARLELISPDLLPAANPPRTRAAQVRGKIQARLGRLGRSLLNYFCGATDPRISVRPSGNGRSSDQYRVFDPLTRQHLSFQTERELRVWLDQRYYQ